MHSDAVSLCASLRGVAGERWECNRVDDGSDNHMANSGLRDESLKGLALSKLKVSLKVDLTIPD